MLRTESRIESPGANCCAGPPKTMSYRSRRCANSKLTTCVVLGAAASVVAAPLASAAAVALSKSADRAPFRPQAVMAKAANIGIMARRIMGIGVEVDRNRGWLRIEEGISGRPDGNKTSGVRRGGYHRARWGRGRAAGPARRDRRPPA